MIPEHVPLPSLVVESSAGEKVPVVSYPPPPSLRRKPRECVITAKLSYRLQVHTGTYTYCTFKQSPKSQSQFPASGATDNRTSNPITSPPFLFLNNRASSSDTPVADYAMRCDTEGIQGRGSWSPLHPELAVAT